MVVGHGRWSLSLVVGRGRRSFVGKYGSTTGIGLDGRRCCSLVVTRGWSSYDGHRFGWLSSYSVTH